VRIYRESPEPLGVCVRWNPSMGFHTEMQIAQPAFCRILTERFGQAECVAAVIGSLPARAGALWA